MHMQTIDWTVVGVYLALSLAVGLLFSRRAGSSAQEFFLSGRSMPWWLLGVSMVATTFSTDTPNLVTDIVRTQGVSGNWVWWAFLLTGMLTTFVYARLWRRSGVETDVEFYELRYSGPMSRFLRGFRAAYLGAFFNVMIMASVTLATIKIGGVLLGVEPLTVVIVAGTITVLYSMVGGLRGVVVTDFVQFLLAMAGSVIAAVWALRRPEVGGLDGLLSHPDVVERIDFLPDFSNPDVALAVFVIPLAVQWWSVWYPGSEPGGGGYVAQRMLAARSEGHAQAATLFFNVAHYALRPWPWIIVALCSIVVFPDLESLRAAFPGVDPRVVGHDLAYPAMLSFLPAGLLGLVVASLAAAYMSTISTHLNWGSSYLVHDLYRRFVNPEASERRSVLVGRVLTAVLMICAGAVSLVLSNALQAFQILLQIGAGTGLLFLMRWFWWRVNAVAELVAMTVSFVNAVYLQFVHARLFGEALPAWQQLVLGVAITTAAWVTAAFVGQATDEATLREFYRRTRPGGPGWERVRRAAALAGEPLPGGRSYLANGIACMALASLAVYGVLFGTGFALRGEAAWATLLLTMGAIAAAGIGWLWKSRGEEPGGGPGAPDRSVRTAGFVVALVALGGWLGAVPAHAIDARAAWDGWPEARFVETSAPCLRHQELLHRLDALGQRHAGRVRIEEVGRSVQGRSIHLVTLGDGPRKVLLWSQMHGDEPSATPALLDLADTLLRTSSADADARRILERFTLLLVPMLNPDGAEVYSRRNAQGIDINRDALNLTTPEGRLLKSLRDQHRPFLGFNLHDQNRRRTVGETKVMATNAVLAVVGDVARTETPGRRLAMRAAAAIATALEPFVPGGMSRYDDAWSERAFGDNLTAWGTPVVLIESGGVPRGWSLSELTRLNYVALLVALRDLAKDDLARHDPATYWALPENNVDVWADVVLRGADILQAGSGPAYRADLAFNVLRSDREAAGCGGAVPSAPARSRVVELGDARVFGAAVDLDLTGRVLVAPFVVALDGIDAVKWLDGDLLDRLARWGVGSVRWSVEGEELAAALAHVRPLSRSGRPRIDVDVAGESSAPSATLLVLRRPPVEAGASLASRLRALGEASGGEGVRSASDVGGATSLAVAWGASSLEDLLLPGPSTPTLRLDGPASFLVLEVDARRDAREPGVDLGAARVAAVWLEGVEVPMEPREAGAAEAAQ